MPKQVLSMTDDILAVNIYTVKGVKQGKLWGLFGYLGDSLIIKNEGKSAEKLEGSRLAAEAIDPSARMVLLSARETDELLKWCRSWEHRIAPWWKGANLAPADPNKVKAAVDEIIDAQKYGPYVKMVNHSVHQKLEKVVDGDMSILPEFVEALVYSDGLERLGKVVAGDMYNNNGDRFQPTDMKEGKSGVRMDLKAPLSVPGANTQAAQLRVIVNPGNIVIVFDSRKGYYRPSMLDYVDSSNLLDTSARPEDWFGQVLIDRTKRRKFAADIVADLEYVFCPGIPDGTWRPKLEWNSVERLEQGMKDGVRALQDAIKRKYPGLTNMPAGVQWRWNALMRAQL